ncbi:CHASE domain-containing protein [Reinekea sp.]|uniref:CHASE domain-containing protein n=1 Tax=Reinekea sp. TaxID=1970455 RepID=UPI002A7FEAB8|nr:CHASE domain-containing protein [Reinekea sp.]
MRNKLTLANFGKWPIVTLVGCLLLTGVAVYKVNKLNIQQLSEALDSFAVDVIEQIDERIELYQYGLRGARGSILTTGTDNLSRELFQTYSNSRDLDSEFPGARGFGYIKRVKPVELDDFIRFAQADDWPDFAVTELSPNDAERFIILYIEPVGRNLQAVGLDIGSEKNRRAAAQGAIDSGRPQLTSPITLVQASGSSLQSFLILLPVFADGITPATPAERNALAVGWTYAPLLMDEVLADLEGMTEYIHLELFDVTDPGQRIRFYDNDNGSANNLLQRNSIQEVFGRSWEVQFTVQPAFVASLKLMNISQVSVFGLVLSLLVTGLVMSTLASRKNKQLLIDQQSRLAAIVASSDDAIISNDEQGLITSWNKAAERIFGFSHSEALGQSVVALIVPQALQAEEATQGAKAQANKTVPAYEAHYQAKAATYPIPVAVTLSAVFDNNGLAQGVSRTIRDISRQKEAEAAIIVLNLRLESQVMERTKALAELNTLFVNILRASSEVGIIATDLLGVVTVFNSGAERILGHKQMAVVGQLTPMAFHAGAEIELQAEEIWRNFGERVSGLKVLTFKAKRYGSETTQWTYIALDGSQVPVTVAVTGIYNESEELVGYLYIATDITRQLNYEQAILAARDQLQMAASVANLGVWSWSPVDNTLEWNDFMYRLYDQPIELKDGGLGFENWRDRIHPDDLEATEASLAAAVAGTGRYDPIFRIILPDGRIRFVQGGAQVERNAAGEAVQVTGINLDITSQQELEAVLRNAKELSDAASAAKSTFLANMSHEIRTPMNAVLGMLQLVRQTHLTDHQTDYITKAQRASKSLLELLNDTLDYSKIEAGKLELDPHSFEFEELMQDLAIVLSGNQGKKDVELLFDMDPNLPKYVFGDRLRLKQILINLASNALKFTPQGEVVVKIKAISSTPGETNIAIDVRDTGIGISTAQIERIFEGFVQAESSITRRYGGTGLGLVITKNLVALMGGELRVDSEPDQGSRFHFSLTLPIVNLHATQDSWQVPQQSLDILVVDDNPIAREVLAGAVKSLGWSATAVESAQEVLDIFNQGTGIAPHFDVMLLDWRMPSMGGEELLKALLTLQKDIAIPVILVVTAHGRDIVGANIDLGHSPVIGYLTKPVTPQQIKEAIYSGLPELGFMTRVAPNTRDAVKKRLENLKLLVVEDNELNRQVAQELLTNEGARVDLAEGGVLGVAAVLAGPTVYDLVLMDLQMPDIDGLEATRRIRCQSAFDDLPILAMTANVSTEDKLACINAGMNGHLGKPIDIDRVVAKIIQTLSAPTRPSAGELDSRSEAASSIPLPPEVDAPTIENFDDILNRFGRNHDLFARLLPSFADSSVDLIADLKRAIAHQNADAASSALHTLKGSAGNMGARAISELARYAEDLIKVAPATSLISVLPADLPEQLSQALNKTTALLQRAIDAVPAVQPTIQVDSFASTSEAKAALVELRAQLTIGSLAAQTLVGQLPLMALPEGFDQGKILALKHLIVELNYPAAIISIDELVAVVQ